MTVSEPAWVKDGVVKAWRVRLDPNVEPPSWCQLRTAPITVRLSVSGED